jgi:WD40 repeat protein
MTTPASSSASTAAVSYQQAGRGGGEGAGYIAVARDHDIWLLDTVTGRKLGVLENKVGPVAHICMDGFNARLACTVQTDRLRKDYDYRNPEHCINVWNLGSRELTLTIRSQVFRACIDLCKDGTKVVAAHHKKPKVFVYDTTNGELILSLVNDPDTIFATCLRFTHENNRFLVGYDNSHCSLFDTDTGDKIMDYGFEMEHIVVKRILCSPDGSLCYAVMGGGLYAFDMVSGQKLWCYYSYIFETCFDIDCSGIFVSDIDYHIRRIDAADGSMTMDVAVGGQVRLAAFNQANNSLVLGKSAQILFMGVMTGEATVILDNWNALVCPICCSSPPTAILL